MRNVNYDCNGNEYRTYSTSGGNSSDKGTHDGPKEIRHLAGEVLDKKTKIYMNATGEKDYSKAFHLILECNLNIKRRILTKKGRNHNVYIF